MKIKNAIIILVVSALAVLGFLAYLYFVKNQPVQVPIKTIKVETKNGTEEIQIGENENELQKIEDLEKAVLEQRKNEIINNLKSTTSTSTTEDEDVKEERINNMRKLLTQ